MMEVSRLVKHLVLIHNYTLAKEYQLVAKYSVLYEHTVEHALRGGYLLAATGGSNFFFANFLLSHISLIYLVPSMIRPCEVQSNIQIGCHEEKLQTARVRSKPDLVMAVKNAEQAVSDVILKSLPARVARIKGCHARRI